MAYTELTEGVKTFASAAWADATGFGAGAELRVAKNYGPITAGLDQSGVDIKALNFEPTSSGVVGGAGASLQVLADGVTASDGVSVRGRNTVFLAAAGTPGANLQQIGHIDLGGSSNVTLTGGDFGVLTVGGNASVTVSASAVVADNTETSDTNYANFQVAVKGGTTLIEYASTAIKQINVYAGTVILRRPCESVYVGQRGTLIDERETGVITNLYLDGGNYSAIRGNVTNVVRKAGTLNVSSVAAPISFGSTSLINYGGSIPSSDLFTPGTETRIGRDRLLKTVDNLSPAPEFE